MLSNQQLNRLFTVLHILIGLYFIGGSLIEFIFRSDTSHLKDGAFFLGYYVFFSHLISDKEIKLGLISLFNQYPVIVGLSVLWTDIFALILIGEFENITGIMGWLQMGTLWLVPILGAFFLRIAVEWIKDGNQK